MIAAAPERRQSARRVVVAVAMLVCIASLAMAQAGCGRPPASAPVAAPAPIGSIKELMDSVIDPTADELFDAVSYNITAAGIEETSPTTPEDWAGVRRHALLLAETTYLLKMPGRRVAPDRPVLEFERDESGPDDLSTEQIQALIDADRDAFNALAQGLADAALLALRAADAKNVDALFASGDAIDNACEACHSTYWYPKDKQPALDALTQRKQ